GVQVDRAANARRGDQCRGGDPDDQGLGVAALTPMLHAAPMLESSEQEVGQPAATTRQRRRATKPRPAILPVAAAARGFPVLGQRHRRLAGPFHRLNLAGWFRPGHTRSVTESTVPGTEDAVGVLLDGGAQGRYVDRE